MMAHQQESTYSRALRDQLLAPSSTEIAAGISHVGESLFAGALELAKNPQPDKCEILLARLGGAMQMVNKLRAALLREAIPAETAGMSSSLADSASDESLSPHAA